MRLSWSEIRARAALFASDHASDSDERRDTQTFYNDFFAIFGLDRRRVAIWPPGRNAGGGAAESYAGHMEFIWFSYRPFRGHPGLDISGLTA